MIRLIYGEKYGHLKTWNIRNTGKMLCGIEIV